SNEPHPSDASERRVWLSHRDCGALMKTCVTAPSVPDGFCVLYAVSNNEDRVHDIANPLGWRPRDGTNALAHATPAIQDGRFSASAKVSFARAAEQTADDLALVRSVAKKHNSEFPERMLELLIKLADVPTAHRVSRFEHVLQTATRALRDGADEETIV